MARYILAMTGGIYVHIPFCASKCHYCDFISFSGQKDMYEAYTRALINEIKGYETQRIITSVYIGGGTPTLLPHNLLLSIIEAMQRFNIAKNAEITVESNPGTINAALAGALRRIGVNRLSIGMQAWQDALLKTLGRRHTSRQFEACMNTVRQAGFDNVNIDVMFSLPGQTLCDWHETLEKAASFQPEHISAYSLTVEKDTPFGALAMKGLLNTPGEDMDRQMYRDAQRILHKKGYEQYEISNFSKPDFLCRHNVLYWERGEYAGFGLNAHSFINGVRYANTSDLQAYINNGGLSPKAEESIVTKRQAMEEYMFLGLRMAKGVSFHDFAGRFHADMLDVFGAALAEHKANGLLNISEDGRVWLTERGIDLSNIVFASLLT